jgi:hypothetical protein
MAWSLEEKLFLMSATGGAHELQSFALESC